MTRRPKSPPPDRLPEEARKRILAWCGKQYPKYLKDLGKLWAGCRDWHLKHDEKACDWEAAFRMWVRKHDQFERERLDRARRERPQEPRSSGDHYEGPLADVISLATRRGGE